MPKVYESNVNDPQTQVNLVKGRKVVSLIQILENEEKEMVTDKEGFCAGCPYDVDCKDCPMELN